MALELTIQRPLTKQPMRAIGEEFCA